jgi:RimJ/RimL family protein N-acetyltransferase
MQRDFPHLILKEQHMSIIPSRIVRVKSGRNILLRSAEPDDAEQLVNLISTILTENDFNITTPEEFRFSVDQEMEWIEDVTESPGHVVIVAEDEDMELLGMLNFHVDPRKRMKHHGSLSINICQGWRDQGLGRAMLQTLIVWAEEEPSIEKLNLEVFATNERAIALYSSLGFQQEGHLHNQIKMAPGEYVDVLLMNLWLKKPL